MSNLTTTIKLDSADMFINSFDITKVATAKISLNANMSALLIPSNDKMVLYGPTSSETVSDIVYFYIQSDITNTAKIGVYITDTNANEILVMLICPGEFAWFPMAAFNANVQLSIENTDLLNSSKINYLFGEKG